METPLPSSLSSDKGFAFIIQYLLLLPSPLSLLFLSLSFCFLVRFFSSSIFVFLALSEEKQNKDSTFFFWLLGSNSDFCSPFFVLLVVLESTWFSETKHLSVFCLISTSKFTQKKFWNLTKKKKVLDVVRWNLYDLKYLFSDKWISDKRSLWGKCSQTKPHFTSSHLVSSKFLILETLKKKSICFFTCWDQVSRLEVRQDLRRRILREKRAAKRNLPENDNLNLRQVPQKLGEDQNVQENIQVLLFQRSRLQRDRFISQDPRPAGTFPSEMEQDLRVGLHHRRFSRPFVLLRPRGRRRQEVSRSW